MEERLHLKGLNGLRAIAAISVVVAHIHFRGSQFKGIWPQGLGSYSVTIFFTLSGFLITYLLLTEKKKAEISIRNFYIRRILRIWPLYFAYLLVAIILICIQTPGKLPGLLPFYLFFAANVPNILSTSLPYLGHYWSLGVEEQFYLFWPWLIKKPAHVFRAMIIFISIFFVLRLIARYLYIKHGYYIPINAFNHTRFDCMAIGGIDNYFVFLRALRVFVVCYFEPLRHKAHKGTKKKLLFSTVQKILYALHDLIRHLLLKTLVQYLHFIFRITEE